MSVIFVFSVNLNLNVIALNLIKSPPYQQLCKPSSAQSDQFSAHFVENEPRLKPNGRRKRICGIYLWDRYEIN